MTDRMEPPYPTLFRAVQGGRYIKSRNGDARELFGKQVEFPAGELVSRKGISHGLGFMELMQILAGVHDVDRIMDTAPKANRALFTPEMAYGPRVGDQVQRIIQALWADPWTRQAVLFIARPEDGPTNSQPCTTALQFLLRDGVLDCHVTMRSWDLTRGFIYDIFFHGGITMAIARCLNSRPGTVKVSAGSLHLYESERERVPEWTRRRFRFADSVPTHWEGIREWARKRVGDMERVPAGVVLEELVPAENPGTGTRGLWLPEEEARAIRKELAATYG